MSSYLYFSSTASITMSRVAAFALRGLELLWTTLIMALIGNMISDANNHNTSVVNYIMFVSVIAMLSLFYLFAVAFNDGLSGHPMLPLALDILNMLFFLCGAIALAAYLGAHSCGDTDYVNSNVVTVGSGDPYKRCHEAQAVCAFLWFGFAAWVGSIVLSAMGGSSGPSMKFRGGAGGVRRGPSRV